MQKRPELNQEKEALNKSVVTDESERQLKIHYWKEYLGLSGFTMEPQFSVNIHDLIYFHHERSTSIILHNV